MDQNSVKLGLLMETAQTHQKLAETAIEKLSQHTQTLEAAVRDQMQRALVDALKTVHTEVQSAVDLRARDRPRAPGDDAASDRLPGRPRQRLRGLGRLRQPLLAGALLRRHRGHHPRSPLRRRRLRAVRARHPAAARRRARPGLPSRGPVEAEADWDTLQTPETYLGYTRSESFASPGAAPRSTNGAPTSSPSACPSTTGAGRRLDDRA